MSVWSNGAAGAHRHFFANMLVVVRETSLRQTRISRHPLIYDAIFWCCLTIEIVRIMRLIYDVITLPKKLCDHASMVLLTMRGFSVHHAGTIFVREVST